MRDVSPIIVSNRCVLCGAIIVNDIDATVHVRYRHMDAVEKAVEKLVEKLRELLHSSHILENRG